MTCPIIRELDRTNSHNVQTKKVRNIKIIYRMAIVSLSVLASFCPVVAEQTSDPYLSESILVGKYCGWPSEFKSRFRGKSANTSITLLTPPTVEFRIKEILKGPHFAGKMPIRYEFCHGDTTKPEDWKFSRSMLPRSRSKWILFITQAKRQGTLGFETCDGCTGRIPFSSANVQKVQEGLYIHKPFDDFHGEFSYRPLTVTVAYKVTEEGQIVNAHLIKESDDKRFNQRVLDTVNSMSGQSFLVAKEALASDNERAVIVSNRLWYENLQ